MNLVHYSNDETIAVESREQDPGPTFKPRGFWVSDESPDAHGWSSWCADEEYGIGPNAHSVNLASDAAILTLTTPEAVTGFDAEFLGSDRYYVNWARVAERWQGIIISPYQWSLRLSGVRWYYSWDCASGCIWDASAIASVARITAEVSS